MALEIDDINIGGTLSATTISATTIVLGSQTLQQIFAPITPSGYLPISGGTLTGETIFIAGLSANTLSGGTLYSGSTNLYSIFAPFGGGGGTSTNVQPGTNITTGGTASNPIVSVVDSPSFNSVTASGASSFTTLSATTLISGSTNLYSIFAPFGGGGGTSTNVQPGTNTYTGGTDTNPTVNVSALTINTITASGDSSFTTLSATTLISGSTNLYSIFAPFGGGGGTSTNVQPGTNITTGGTATSPIINLADSPSVNNITFSGTAIGGTVQADVGTFTSLSAGTLSGGTILSGETNLYSIFQSIGNVDQDPYLNLSGGTVTGNTIFTQGLTATTFSANTINVLGQVTGADGATFTRLSGTTIFVGNSTTGGTVQAEKELVLQQTGDTFGPSILRLRNRTGENGAIYETTDPTVTLVDFIFKTSLNQRNIRYEARTGSAFLTAPEFEFGVAANPTLVVNDTTVLVRGSGGTRTTSLSATTLSGGTIFSGNTNLQTYFNTINSQLTTKANLSGATFTGTVNAPTLSATTLSANTSVFVSGIKFPVSPVAGYMLTSDASGNASWQINPTSGSGTTKLDMQSISTATTTTATSTLVDVPGMILTAKNLGSSATTYVVNFVGTFSNNNNAGNSAIRAVINGAQIPGSIEFRFTNAGASLAAAQRNVALTCRVTGVTNGDVIKIQMSASTGTLTAQAGKSLSIIGTLDVNLV